MMLHLEMLYKWREEIFGENKNKFNIGSSQIHKLQDEYLSHEKLDNDFQFLEVGRYDPAKKTAEERKISFVEIYGEYNQVQASNQAHRC